MSSSQAGLRHCRRQSLKVGLRYCRWHPVRQASVLGQPLDEVPAGGPAGKRNQSAVKLRASSSASERCGPRGCGLFVLYFCSVQTGPGVAPADAATTYAAAVHSVRRRLPRTLCGIEAEGAPSPPAAPLPLDPELLPARTCCAGRCPNTASSAPDTRPVCPRGRRAVGPAAKQDTLVAVPRISIATPTLVILCSVAGGIVSSRLGPSCPQRSLHTEPWTV